MLKKENSRTWSINSINQSRSINQCAIKLLMISQPDSVSLHHVAKDEETNEGKGTRRHLADFSGRLTELAFLLAMSFLRSDDFDASTRAK